MWLISTLNTEVGLLHLHQRLENSNLFLFLKGGLAGGYREWLPAGYLVYSLYHVNEASPYPFGVEYIISMWKINVEDLIFTEFPSRWYSVSLSFISLISLFLLLNSFNPHAPTLECVNIVKAET